jgi:hypothetical protein
MSGADKNARGQGGLEAGRKNLISYNISKKQLTIKSKIIHLRQRWNLEIADFDRFAIFIARFFLDYAPIDVRARFMGAPGNTPRETVDLAETFLLLYALAEDKATATDTKYSLTEIWRAAVQLAGGVQ